ncbi:MAG TPA: ABC transporter substrate-binding protein [Solirubrobacteraceae bacterium]|nr:ABC transporter substrate-binding protein [Solirubrobacteraceae bacterium]
MRRTRRLLGACLAGACLLALGACGAKQDALTAPGAKPFNVMLDWFPNADHAALYTALAHGEFRDVGLDVHLVAPSQTDEPLKLLAAGKVDMAVSYEPELLLARDQGLHLVSIGALVQRPLTSIIALQSAHISSVADLRGKTVGTAGIPYQAAMLKAALHAAHVSDSAVKEVNVGFDLVPAMLSGKVDATLGGYWNYEAIQLRQQHKKPNVIPVSRGGVPTYDELVLVTTEKYFANHVSLLRRLVQAIARGYYAVRSNPSQGVAALDAANPSLDPKLQNAAVRATLPAFFPGEDKPWGWQFQDQWNAYGKWMYEHRLIKHLAARDYASTNQLLAGQGP